MMKFKINVHASVKLSEVAGAVEGLPLLIHQFQNGMDLRVATAQNDFSQASTLFGADTMTQSQRKDAHRSASKVLLPFGLDYISSNLMCLY